MTVAELLTEANWAKGSGAFNVAGEAINPRREDACKFCLAGAVYRCYNGEEELYKLDEVAQYIRDHYKTEPHQNEMDVIVAFNDYHARWADIENIIKELKL